MTYSLQTNHVKYSAGCTALCITLMLTTHNPAHAAVASSYFSNPVLAQTVSIDRVPISVKSLCSLLSHSGVQLTASADYANQQLQIQITDQPINQVMTSVAKLLTGKWISASSNHSYELIMKPEAVDERQRWWKKFNEITRLIKTKEYDFKLAQFHIHQPTYVTGHVNGKLTHEVPNLNDLSFFSRLPDKIQRQLVKNSENTTSISPPYNGNISMETQKILVRYSDLPKDDQTIIQPQINTMNPYESNISNSTTNPILDLDIWSGTINIFGIFKDNDTQMFQYTRFIDTFHDPYNYATGLLNPYSSFTNIYAIPKDVSSICRQLAAFPQSVFPINHNNIQPSFITYSNAAPYRRTDKLEWLAHIAGVQYIADYYDDDAIPLLAPHRLPALQEPLALELDQIASRNNCSWHKEKSGIILVRDNTWYRDDKAQPPLTVIKKMWKMVHNAESLESVVSTKKQRTDIQHKLQIDLECYAYQHLTPLQIIGGLQFYVLEPGDNGYASPNSKYPLMPFRHIATNLFQEESIIKFYHSLTPVEQDQFLRSGLNILKLSELQEKYAVQCCPSLLYCIDNPKKNLLSFLTLQWSNGANWNDYPQNNDIAISKPDTILPGYTFNCHPTLPAK